MPRFGTVQPHNPPQPRKSLKPRRLGARSQKLPRNAPWDAEKGPPGSHRAQNGRHFDQNPKPRPWLGTYSKD